MKTINKLFSFSIVCIFITTAAVFLLFYFPAPFISKQLLIVLIFIISPFFLICNKVATKKVKIINYITVCLCFVIGVSLGLDFRFRTLEYDKVSDQNYIITNTLNNVVEFKKEDYKTQIISKKQLDANIDSLQLYQSYIIDIFGNKM